MGDFQTSSLIDDEKLSARADKPLSALPRPFLRWAGSKRHLLPYLVDVLPKRFGTYREPFLGSGSLFFLLQPHVASLSDSCEALIDTYGAVREGVVNVMSHLKQWKPDKKLYYAIRENMSEGRFKRAAEFIYLNKTCWNGLYRVNSDGKFNVPFGLPKSDAIADPNNLRACSALLRQPGIRLFCDDFDAALESASQGDLVFLDPPYVTSHSNNGFLEYNEAIFSWSDQQRLARVAKTLLMRGVHVIVTNADHKPIRDLYRGFDIKRIKRPSTLASDKAKRRIVSELIFHSAR